MILDVVLVAVVALLMIIGYRRGLAKTLFGFACTLVSGIAAYLGARYLANLIYKNIIMKAISDSVAASLSQAVSSSGKLAGNVIDGLPDFASGILSFFGITSGTIADSVDVKSSAEVLCSAVNAVTAPVLISVFTVVLIIILFIVFKLLLRLVGRYVLKLFELPIIRRVNALLGGAFGLLEGLVLIYAAILVIRIILPFLNEPLITPELINSSYLFKAIYYLEFTGLISDVVNSGVL